jgi:uridylate kinase
MKYKRILQKLSGEALMGDERTIIDPVRAEYAVEIKNSRPRCEIAMVLVEEIFLGVTWDQ